MGALPIDHAAAHDNDASLEITHIAFKQGSNDIDAQGRIHQTIRFDLPTYIKKDTLIGVIKNPSVDYEISFKLTILTEDVSHGGLIRFTADRNSNYAKCGDRNPLMFLCNNYSCTKQCRNRHEVT